MANEFKQKCGKGYYWCNTDNVCKPIEQVNEDGVGMVGGSPVNNAGGGQIAGIGVGPQGEPGMKKKKMMPFMGFIRRKPPTSVDA
tara:strand:+ start:165 stop:419 length:255 start_codon:yes stop_codon:yes gene_type:complete